MRAPTWTQQAHPSPQLKSPGAGRSVPLCPSLSLSAQETQTRSSGDPRARLSVQAPHPKACCTKLALDWGGSWSLPVTPRGQGAGYPTGTNTLVGALAQPTEAASLSHAQPQTTAAPSQPGTILEASGLSIARAGPTAHSGHVDFGLHLVGAGELGAWGQEGRGLAGSGMALRRGHWGWGRVRTQVWGLVVSQALRAWGRCRSPLAVEKTAFQSLTFVLTANSRPGDALHWGKGTLGGGPPVQAPARPQGTRRPLLWPWCCRHRGAEPFRAPRQGPHPGSSHARHQPCLPGGRGWGSSSGEAQPSAQSLSFPLPPAPAKQTPPSRDHVWHAHVSVTLPWRSSGHVSRLDPQGPGTWAGLWGGGCGNCWATEPEHWALRHGGVCTGVCRGPETQPARKAHHSGGRHRGPGSSQPLGALVSLETLPTCGHLGDIAGLAPDALLKQATHFFSGACNSVYTL